MLWLIIAIISYFFFSLADFGNKFVLSGPPNPKIYTFWAGLLGALIIVIAPFINFTAPGYAQLFLSIFTGIIYILALFGLYKTIEDFEVSRVVPAIGGIVPIFTFILSFLFFNQESSFSYEKLLIFGLLLLGSVLINWQKKKSLTKKSLKIILITSFLFALYFILAKLVYLEQPFWQGFIWIRIGGLFPALFLLLFSKEVKQEIFYKKTTFSKQLGAVFILSQGSGALATILQNLAINLAPPSNLAIINAMQGIEYVFLFLLILISSLKFPNILEEKITAPVLIQKITSILIIASAMVLLII